MAISLVKRLDRLGQSNGLESVNSEMQSPAYQNEEAPQFAVATSLVWLAEEHLPKSVTTTTITNAIECSFSFSSQAVAKRTHVYYNLSTENDPKSMFTNHGLFLRDTLYVPLNNSILHSPKTP
jgi:hypothetical protein